MLLIIVMIEFKYSNLCGTIDTHISNNNYIFKNITSFSLPPQSCAEWDKTLNGL